MATTSLGRLTLDLAVRLSDFTDGLTQAERQARDSASNISDSVSELRDNITDDISRISGSFAGMAIGGIAVAAGAIAALAVETAKADVQLGIMAGTANTSLESFQVLSYAAAGFGVEQEALGAIIADTQEKLGEFSATGGGGAADFMEALQNNTKMTDEQIRELGKTLQSKDGVGAIQYLKDELDALGATSQEQRFIMESLAGDLGNLMPLFANGGAILEEYGVQLTDAGVIKTAEAIEQSRRLAAQTQAIQTQFEGLKTQLVASTIPAMSTLIEYFQEGSKKGRGFTNEVNGVGESVRVTTGLIIGLAASVSTIAQTFQAVSAQMRAIGQTTINFVEADGVVAKSKALIAGTITSAGLASVSMRSISDEYERAVRAFEASSNGQQNRLTGLAAVQYEANNFLQSNTRGLAINTVEMAANEKAIDARTKALEKAQKTAGKVDLKPNAKALNNAEDYGFASYEAQYGLPQGLMTGIHMQESHGNTKATGPSTKWGTAKGGFQLIDATAKRFQVDNAYNMEQATEGAAKYLSYLYKHFNGDLAKTIAAYNTGEGNVDNNPMSLILSDRWARNKKTGIGQTKEYTKNVLAYMKSATTDTSKLVYDTVSKQAQDAQKLQEDTLKRQQSIQVKYATAREKLDRDYVADITEIESLYAEGSLERTDLLNRAKTEYEEKRQAKAKSILETYMSDEVKLGYEHNKKIDAINAEFAHDDTTREMLIDLQKAAYQEDLDNFRFTSQAKAREQDKMYQSLANSMKANGLSAAGTGLDAMAQRTMSGQDYEVWRLAQDHDESFNSVNSEYSNRQAEINAMDERGEFALPELERFELLELAKQEHMDKMWAMEQEYALKDQTLAEQQTSQKIAMYQSLFSSIAGLTKAFAGEQSTAYRIMFGIEQGFAIAQAAMAIQQSIAKAMTIGYPQNIPIIAEVVGQGAQIVSNIKNITMGGIAHGGLDYVPKEATYLLDEGERVLSPRQNKDLANFMANGQKSNTSDVNINVNVDAKGNGQMTGDTSNALGRKMAEGMKQVAKSVIIQEKRQGGLLYGT